MAALTRIEGRGEERGETVPAVTDPPGELMYRFIGFSGLSASRKSSCATMDAEVVSSTSPLRHTMRSFSSREKMSSLTVYQRAVFLGLQLETRTCMPAASLTQSAPALALQIGGSGNLRWSLSRMGWDSMLSEGLWGRLWGEHCEGGPRRTVCLSSRDSSSVLGARETG